MHGALSRWIVVGLLSGTATGGLALGCAWDPLELGDHEPLGGEPPLDAGLDSGTTTSSSSSGGGPDVSQPPTPPTDFVPTVTGRGGGAATVDVRASWAAIEALRAGGNAVDAAVAAAAMLGVTDPFSCGIGGGGFMLVYRADTREVVVIEHREEAPGGMDRSAFYEGGAPIPFLELVTSGLSVGVPGVVRGWDEALRRYGTRSLADALELATFVAESGFDVDQTFFDQTTRNLDRFQQIPSSSELFLGADAQPLPVGATFRNPDLAATYRLLAEGGPGAFYGGELAQAVVSTIQDPPILAGSPLNVRPGLMTLTDLSTYEARVRPAVRTTYRGYEIYGAGLPSSGGLTVGMSMNLLEGFDPASTDATGWLHRYLESSKLAFADRNAFMGDPEFVSVPVEGMLSKAYADARRALIDPALASAAPASPGDPASFQQDPSGATGGQGSAAAAALGLDAYLDLETTHITVVDAAGNAVAYTCTIESEGGNGIVVPGYGFLLNNELTDFAIPPNVTDVHPNVLEPGKRPRSSIAPTMVMEGDRLVLALGSPGGSTIITTALQIMTSYLDLAMPLPDALAAPRVSQRNTPSAAAETAFLATPEAAALQALGHVFVDAGAIGAATAIEVAADGTLTVAAEPVRRNGGSAMVVEAQ